MLLHSNQALNNFRIGFWMELKERKGAESRWILAANLHGREGKEMKDEIREKDIVIS